MDFILIISHGADRIPPRFMKHPIKSRGFTLIELLVVISVIGLLASVILISLNSARIKARIAFRVATMKQIATALELYYDNNNGYPVVPTPWRTECSGPVWAQTVSADQVIPGLVPNYIAKFPSDPSMDAPNALSCFLYYSDGINYKFMDHVMIEMSQANYLSHPELIDPLRDGGPTVGNCVGSGDGTSIWAWSVYTTGAQCW